MVSMGMITKAEEPTYWILSLPYAWIANGNLQMCFDWKDLNGAIWWDHHRTPMVAEVAHEFADSQYLTKVDIKSGY